MQTHSITRTEAANIINELRELIAHPDYTDAGFVIRGTERYGRIR